MGGGGGEEFQATSTQGNLEEEPKPNMDQVIDNIQVKLVILVKLVVPITKSKLVVVETSQLVQHEVEHVQIENPSFFITNLSQFIVIPHNLRQINI
jgi:hypothetical protein